MLISYKNDEKLKSMMVEEMKLHQKQDAFIKGSYGNENGIFKGCAVGCSIRSINIKLGKKIAYDKHAAYETELGIPEWLARLEDIIFEGLPEKESKDWPVEFLEAIPVGKNLEPVQFKFKKFLLKENFERVQKLTIDESLKNKVLMAIDMVMAVIDGAIKTGKVSESARSAAWSAARSAAWSAARSAAESARSAAESARSAAWSAAWSAAESARSAAESARSAAFIRYKNELLRLLREV